MNIFRWNGMYNRINRDDAIAMHGNTYIVHRFGRFLCSNFQWASPLPFNIGHFADCLSCKLSTVILSLACSRPLSLSLIHIHTLFQYQFDSFIIFARKSITSFIYRFQSTWTNVIISFDVPRKRDQTKNTLASCNFIWMQRIDIVCIIDKKKRHIFNVNHAWLREPNEVGGYKYRVIFPFTPLCHQRHELSAIVLFEWHWQLVNWIGNKHFFFYMCIWK